MDAKVYTFRKRDDTTGELSACPFCGGEPQVKHIGNDYTKKRAIEIRCQKCRCARMDAVLRFGWDWLEDTAARNWNQRPVTAENYQQIERGGTR